MHRTVKRLAVGLAAATLVGSLSLPAMAAAARTSFGSVPAWATGRNLVGHAKGHVTFRVVLHWRDQADLLDTIAAVSSPTSPSYGRYLTPAQFRARFAPSQGDVDRVSSWLRSQGFRVGSVPSNHLWVEASGSVAQAEKSFHATLNMYRFMGRVLRSPANDVSIPASVAGVVSAVTGLDQTMVRFDHEVESAGRPSTGRTLPPLAPVFLNAPPCSKYWGEKIATDKPPAYGHSQPYAPCGLEPRQIRAAYGVDQVPQDGTGVTVAIIDAYRSPTIRYDLGHYSKLHGLPAPHLTQQIYTQGSQDTGWYGEETLDLESVHSMAPMAHELYVGASNNGTSSLDLAMNDVINTSGADMVSNSYGVPGELNVPPGTRSTEDQMYQQGAAQGVGIYFSSGDNGDETHVVGQRETDWPAASAWVTAVGGTTLGTAQHGGYGFETFWGTYSTTQNGNSWSPAPPGAFRYAGGGGTSRVEAEPNYQKAIVPQSLSGFFGGSNRVVPDVSLVGDPSTGFLIGYTQLDPDGQARYSEQRIGGTSLSSPAFAGIMALADQKAGQAHGFLNPALYSIGTSTTAFHDIVAPADTVAMVRNDYVNGYDPTDGISTTLRTTNQLDTLHIFTGYDDATGIGTPIVPAFLQELPG